MGFIAQVKRFPWQSTVNLTLQAGAEVEAMAAIIDSKRPADILREAIREGMKVLATRLDQEEKKRFESLTKTLLDQKDLRKVIAADKKKEK